MTHRSIEALVHRFQNRELHAAHSGREVMSAFVELVSDSDANTTTQIAEEVDSAIGYLLPNMPAYAPPINVLHKFLFEIERAVDQEKSVVELKAQVVSLGDQFHQWSQKARADIVEISKELIPHNASIFTFTLSETVLTTLRNVWKSGKRFDVSVTESRPNNDGVTTAKKLVELGIPVLISIDSGIPEMLSNADLMVVGAEAILTNGGAICKVGTYLAALVAYEFGVPVFVLVDTMKFDVSSKWGVESPLDPLNRSDFSEISDIEDAEVGGHLFDITPAKYIQGIVTELGVLNPITCNDVMSRMSVSRGLLQKLRDL